MKKTPSTVKLPKKRKPAKATGKSKPSTDASAKKLPDRHAVLERIGTGITVTLHKDQIEAEAYAMALAAKNMNYTESEVMFHFATTDTSEEGDYAVTLAIAHEVRKTK